MSAVDEADLIVTNARITTLDDGRREATALAAHDGRFVAVGTDADVLARRTARTQVINANGRRIVPGLNDSHIHVIRGGLNHHLELRWDGVPSLADALRMLKNQAIRTPPPQWVRVVGGWSEFQFAEREQFAVAGDTPPNPARPAFASVTASAEARVQSRDRLGGVVREYVLPA